VAGCRRRSEGGKRPRTTLSPSLALRDGEPRLAFGTPGGDQQDRLVLQFFITHAIFGHELQAAIDAPSFHTAHFPSSFSPHESFPGRLHLEVEDQAVLAVGRDPKTGMLAAAADPRAGQAYAAGR
jgi:gamma-glutamyltranspeptidase/glutathione hydrolase